MNSPRIRKGLGLRWHFALTYLIIIWVTLAVITNFIARTLERSTIESRKSALFAQAHLLVSSMESRGGPESASVTSTGGVPPRGRVLVLDGNGKVLEDSALDPAMLGRNLTHVTEVSSALKGEQVANTYYLPDKSYVMYLAVPADWKGTGGAVFISQDLQDIVGEYQDFMRAVFVGGLFASLAAIALAWGLSDLVTEPIFELSRTANRMASGRLDVRVRPRGPRETRLLGDSFNAMASEIEKTMKTQEEFLVHAAHELRSPLAAINILVESMQIKSPTNEELPEILSDVKGELNRIIGTTEGILNLLRSKGDFSKSRVKPAVILEELVSRFRGAAHHVVIQLDVDDVTCTMSSLALNFVASNLLDNAVKYTPPGGEVNVSCVRDGNDLVLTVRDTGIGIDNSDIPRLFERFYRADVARQKSTGGAGLGLSIVKGTCQRTNASIVVTSQLGEGSVFTVTWKDVVQEIHE